MINKTLQRWDAFYREGRVIHWMIGSMWAVQGLAVAWAFVFSIYHGNLNVKVALPLILLEIWAVYSIYKIIKHWKEVQSDCNRIRQEIINEG